MGQAQLQGQYGRRFDLDSSMERGKLRPARAGGQWTSAQCVEKVEEMLSRAICQQEDLWGMLVIHSSPENNAPVLDQDSSTGAEVKGEGLAIPPHLLKALKVKLENSMDWCHLALCRLKEIISHSSSSELITGLNSSPRLNHVPSPLSALPSHTGRLHHEWSPGTSTSVFFSQSRAQTCDGERLQESMSLTVLEGEERFSSLGLDSDWNMLAEAPTPSDLPAFVTPSEASCRLNLRDASDNELDQSLGSSKLNSRGLRPRSCDPKRERVDTEEKDTTVSVVFQELKPGDDTKKGIPDDGHRGWKKYGNKTIQNSTFCRGYYKCSMKDCRAKKMVQPTDKNPAVFEVTYVGSHTCSSTSRRRHRSRATPKPSTAPVPNAEPKRRPPPCPGPGPGDVLVQTKIARLLKSQLASSNPTSNNITSNAASIPDADPTYGRDAGGAEMGTGGGEVGDKSWHESRELSDVIDGSRDVEDCSDFDRAEDVYLDQMSSRGEVDLGFHSFQPDSLLWQEILSSSHREGWTGLQVEI